MEEKENREIDSNNPNDKESIIETSSSENLKKTNSEEQTSNLSQDGGESSNELESPSTDEVDETINEPNLDDENVDMKLSDNNPEVIETSVKNWDKIVIDDTFGFKTIQKEELDEILAKSRQISPIINEMFKKIIEKCSNFFNFDSSRISFEEYLDFYKEVNRLIPSLEKKIIQEDCNGSVFFVGDSHGSIEDSFYVIDFFMRIIKEKPNDKIIYVGDYVDRNPYDLQNLTLIVAFSILFPENVVLLRGNHEDRTINEYYGFKDNLLRRFYGDAEIIYEQIIKFFTHLPIAHVSQIKDAQEKIGARIFTVHGGIPIDPLDFNQPKILEDIEPLLICERERSEEMDPLTISMLWSDPDELIQFIVTDDNNTGRMQFGWPILDQFLKANNLDVVVRGHQKWNAGYKIFFNYKLFSLFSTSKYDNRKKFDPKILQLELGKAPNIIEIDPIKMKAIADNYLSS